MTVIDISINSAECLRPISYADLEYLRLAKNANRASFFHREMISREQQDAWFRRYSENSSETMYLLISHAERIGIIGIRVLNNREAELYNVMRVDSPTPATRGAMTRALSALARYYRIENGTRIFRALVVHGNPALKWYARNGFNVLEDTPEATLIHLVLE